MSHSDYEGMARTLHGAMLAMEDLVRAGFFPCDNTPDNFCLHDKAIRLLNLGAVRKMRRGIRGFVDDVSPMRAEFVGRNRNGWMRDILAGVPLGKIKALDSVVRRFVREFDTFNAWKRVQSLYMEGEG